MADALYTNPASLIHNRFIKWPTSDGTNPPKVPHDMGIPHAKDADGKFNWAVEIEPGEKAHDKWLEHLGTYIAGAMFKDDTDGREYVMDGLPTGYTLYRRYTGDRKRLRSDVYLWGSVAGYIFRSPNEFLPHAMWLMAGAREEVQCICKYCIKKVKPSQIDININLCLPGIRSHKNRHQYPSYQQHNPYAAPEDSD